MIKRRDFITLLGKDSIDHPPNGHDDLANCVAGLFSLAKYGGRYRYDETLRWVGSTEPDADAEKTAARDYERQRLWAHIRAHTSYYNHPLLRRW